VTARSRARISSGADSSSGEAVTFREPRPTDDATGNWAIDPSDKRHSEDPLTSIKRTAASVRSPSRTIAPLRNPPLVRGPEWPEKHFGWHIDRRGVRYDDFPGVLFGPRGPRAADVMQHWLSNCSWMSVLASLAEAQPEYVVSMFRFEPPNVAVRFFLQDRWDGEPREVWQPISTDLPLKRARSFGWITQERKPFYTAIANGVLWPSLAQKAFADFFSENMPTRFKGPRGGYNAIASGGSTVRTSMRLLTGREPESLYVPTTPPGVLFDRVRSAIDRSAVLVASAYLEQSGVNYDLKPAEPGRSRSFEQMSGQRRRHVTSIIDAREINGVKSIKVREQAVGDEDPAKTYWVSLQRFSELVQVVNVVDVDRPSRASREPSGRPRKRLGPDARALERSFLAWARTAARAVGMNGAQLMREYLALRRRAGSSAALTALLDRLPRDTIRDGFPGPAQLPSLARLLRAGVLAEADMPSVLAILRDKQAQNLQATAIDLLLPEGASEALARAWGRIAKEGLGDEPSMGRFVERLAAEARRIEGQAIDLDLGRLERLGFQRPRPTEWAQMRETVRMRGHRIV
jgi:hypothetical protein